MPNILIKKNHFKQENKASCVPAAARIVLNYLGVKIDSEAYLRKILKTRITGTNIFNLGYLKDEKQWDVDVRSELGTLAELERLLKNSKAPVIVLVDTLFLDYWDISTAHVLVVVGYDEDNIVVNDPFFENQEIKIPKTIFIQAWSVFQNLMVIISKKQEN